MLEVLWIIIPILIGVGIFLVYWFYLRDRKEKQGWDCVEGDCERVLGGEYKTYEQCRNRCADNRNNEGYGSCSSNRNTEAKKVRFQEEPVVTKIEDIQR